MDSLSGKLQECPTKLQFWVEFVNVYIQHTAYVKMMTEH